MAFDPEDVTIWGAAVTSLAATLAAATHVRGGGVDHYSRARRLAFTSAILHATGLALLAAYCLAARVDVDYVWRHVRGGAPWPYRLAGLWASHEGTLLLWATVAALALALNARLWQRRVDAGQDAPPDAQHPLPWTLLFGFGVVLALDAILLTLNVFDPTPAWRLAAEPDGRGLQPILETPFMVIHPPVQFFAYGLTVLLFAAALSHAATGRREWVDLALPWARLTLATAWIGLSLGALWAYYVLNFGGYWAWDPVETGNLIAFLPLIPLLHGLIYVRKRGLMPTLTPLAGLLTLPAVLFSTITTRSGLWVSVHAFTDPSQSFTRDPLLRLLHILDAEPLVRHLTSLLLLLLAAAVVAHLARLRRARDATGVGARLNAGVLALDAGTYAAASLGLLAALDPRLVLGLLFEGGHRLFPANAPIGVALILLLAIVILAWPALRGPTQPKSLEGSWLERWIVMGNLVFVGMLLVMLALLVVFLLDVGSVNGYHREVYDDRAPLVAVPLLLVLGVALSNQSIGRGTSLLVATAACALGGVLALAWPDGGWLAFGLPVFLFALAAASLKLFKVSDPGRLAPQRLRWAGLVLLLGGLAALVYWANPPARIAWGVGTWRPSAWWAAWGYAMGLLAVLGSVATLRRRNLRLALLGGVALVASVAWIVAVPLGLWALIEVGRARNDFAEGRNAWDLRSSLSGLRRPLRKTGVYMVHVALVLGLGGYAASTHGASAEVSIELTRDEPTSAHGYSFQLVGTRTRGVHAGTGLAQELQALVAVRHGGERLGVVALTAWHELPAHYAERVTVERYALEDLYLHPTRFTFTGAAGSQSFEPHQDGVLPYPGSNVTHVAFTAKTLPLMHLVWGGAWMLATGALTALIFAGFRSQTREKD